MGLNPDREEGREQNTKTPTRTQFKYCQKRSYKLMTGVGPVYRRTAIIPNDDAAYPLGGSQRTSTIRSTPMTSQQAGRGLGSSASKS
jgi:hypothetical protein